MVQKAPWSLLVVAMVLTLATAPAWAADSNDEGKKILEGPIKVTYGSLYLVLADGAKAEVQYQPDAKRVTIKTLTGDARAIVPAYLLVLLENAQGTLQARLPNGRIVNVEPGRSEIVGRALVDDPGQIVIRFGGMGPFLAQAGGPLPGPIGSQGSVSDLTGDLAAAVQGAQVETGGASVTPQTTPLSPSGTRGFGE